MRSRHIAFPLVAVLSWGLMFPVLASALTRVDALNLTAVRYLLATVVLLGLLLVREGGGALRPAGRVVEVVVLGVVGFAGFNLLTNLALGHAAPQQIALFVATAPLVTQLVRWARDGVRPGRRCSPSRWSRWSASAWSSPGAGWTGSASSGSAG